MASSDTRARYGSISLTCNTHTHTCLGHAGCRFEQYLANMPTAPLGHAASDQLHPTLVFLAFFCARLIPVSMLTLVIMACRPQLVVPRDRDACVFTSFCIAGPVSTFYAMREALSIVADEGLEPMWKRHQDMHDMLWDGLKQMGLQPFVEKDEDRLITVNTIKVRMGMSQASNKGKKDNVYA
jgi:hypothetical protein